MKFFQCGGCKKTYKIDPSKAKTATIFIKCTSCAATNEISLKPVLLVQYKDRAERLPLKFGTITIGRKTDLNSVDVPIDDSYVSRNHAALGIELKEGKLLLSITDNNSTNGTFNHKKEKIVSGKKLIFSIDEYFIVGLTKISFTFT